VPPIVPASVSIDSFICPVAYEGSDYAVDCTEPSSGVEFSVSRDDAVLETAIADTAGSALFPSLEPGDYVLAAGVPGDFASSRVRCLDAGGVDIARRHATNQIAVALGNGATVACNWYIVPEDAEGEVPEASLTIDVRGCPEGMTPETMAGEFCDPAPQGTLLALRSSGQPVSESSASATEWRWDGLAAGGYNLDVEETPPGFQRFQLDDQTCCGDAADFTIEVPDNGGELRRTLYLFQPAIVEEEQPIADGTISAHVRACAPGMTVDTLDPDACIESPEGVSFSLLDGETPVGVGSAEAEYWWWPNLAYGDYTLVVNAIPEEFTDSSLGSRTCCNEQGGYDVVTDAETPDTGYILYLYAPASAEDPTEEETAEDAPQEEVQPEAATELVSPLQVVDPDGDGLPTTDEEGFFGTDPDDPDSDGDGHPDDDEIAAGTDPLSPD
jgi:hypothetical protein